MPKVAGVVLACGLICTAAFYAFIAARRRVNSNTPRPTRIHFFLLALQMLVLAFLMLFNSIPTQFGLSGGVVELVLLSIAVFTLLLVFAQVYVAFARFPQITGRMGFPVPLALHTWLYGDVAPQGAADGQNSTVEQE